MLFILIKFNPLLIKMPAKRDSFTTDYHMFWSTTGWNPEEQCLRGGSGPYEPECCGRDDGPL